MVVQRRMVNGLEITAARAGDNAHDSVGFNRGAAEQPVAYAAVRQAQATATSAQLTMGHVTVAANGGSTTVSAPAPAPIQTPARAVQIARQKGYEGDPCPECGALTLVRNGACLKCVSCGGTTGCS